MALVSVGGTLGFPILTQRVVNQLAAGAPDPTSIAMLVAVLVVSAVASALSSYLLARAGHTAVASLRGALVGKLLRLPVASFDRDSTGERVSRVLSDCESISDLATHQTVNLLTGALLLAGSVAVLLYLDVRLALALIGCIAGAGAVVIPLTGMMEGLSRGTQDRTAKLGGILTHVFSEIRLVKAFTAEAHERDRSRREIEHIKGLGLRMALLNMAIAPLMSLAMTAAIVVILVYGTSRVSSGAISIGTLTAFILYIFNVAAPLVQLTTFAAELQKAKGASGRIIDILRERSEAPTRGKVPRRIHGILQFRNVSFAYPGRPTKVLHEIDLVFRPGTTTALVGASGNGKTTVLSLIERFYEPSGGAILYDGQPIASFPLAAWRSKIGYVAQGASIMPASVRDNITYGMRSDCSDEMVRAAAQKAGALSFIERMPEGFDTLLIEQGYNLSGGQRQRIAIARMFLRDPEILILDEATSNLDSETEHQVTAALTSLMQGRTNIIVAHRLATIMQADCIYFLDGGRISGAGRHDELVATHPAYARLVEREFLKSKEEALLEA
ncbi:ABC transporter ATP-binding protein [Caldimonas brevitalea]|nr:ABC transporter ATP-binding protein [Caldimonas brevitalea]